MGKRKRERLLACGASWRQWLSEEIQRQIKKKPPYRGHKVSKSTRHRVLLRDEGCRGCGECDTLTMHHIIPKRLGGTNHPDNLITLCKWCHIDWNKAESSKRFKWFQFFVWLDDDED